ncbi:MFS transporter [Rhizobium sp. AC44/96]|uniref:MFS transporter n=1 Tax=Rhizobium sp. AC44/96 TaxID=1841654 RepID=UPI00080F99C9|nr:MFS transporter [Rhizobium sp. AC44/96]OCJ18108.1 MFS transporter [Rhizobium sp. AC44/96]
MTHAVPADDFAPDVAAIAAVIVGVTAFAVAQGLTYPLISLVLEHRGVSQSLIGFNAGCFAGGLATATFAVGWLSRLVRGDRLIVAGLIGCALSLSLFATFDSFWVWCLARFSLGVCVSIIFMLSEAWLNTACPDRLRGRMSGLYGAGMCGGFAAGPLAIPLFGTENGFAFALLAVYVACVAFLTVILSRRARTQPEQAASGALFKFAKSAPMLIVMVAAFAFADIAAISAMPVYFVRLGYSEAFAAISVSVLALPTALAQPLVGWFLDKTSRSGVAVCSGCLAGLSFIAIPFLQSQAAILIAFGIMGAASFSLYTCALTLLGERYNGDTLVAGSAAFALAYAVSSAAGSSTVGAVMDIYSPAAGPIAAGSVVLTLTAVIVAALLRQRLRRAEITS